MDIITQTSLDALLLKATNSQNQNIDTAALDAFCTLLNKEKEGSHIGLKLIAARLPNGTDKEMLQTLNLLDTCMNRCGAPFQSEVGKFRFLNEMIKLVSPKYLGTQTPQIVKTKIVQLMYLWTIDYPKETKIREAYDMLRKQGVIKEIPNPNIPDIAENSAPKRKSTNSIFQDEEKSKILQKLLQSKDPEDIQAANWLIKNMVKEDDKRAELKSRRFYELESVRNNVRLLNEMLDSYKPGISSGDELELIKELHQSCERLRPNLMRLVTETQQNEDILSDILQANDEVSQVFNKFTEIIVKSNVAMNGTNGSKRLGKNNEEILSSLLDFDLNVQTEEVEKCEKVDVLCELFNQSYIPQSDILQPVSLLSTRTDEATNSTSKAKGFDDLDVLSEHLFKENLQPSKQISFHKNQEKIPMNLLAKQSEPTPMRQELNFDLNYLLNAKDESKSIDIADDLLVDISDEVLLESSQDQSEHSEINDTTPKPCAELKLSDILIKLEDVKPSAKVPLTILNERNGLTITLHLARDKPRNDVNVFVVTAVSRNELPLSNYSFQGVVPKGCKLKLQAPSSTELPAFRAFLPPAALTQIMLVLVPPDFGKVYLKFIVSYAIDDETLTEMGEVDDLPIH